LVEFSPTNELQMPFPQQAATVQSAGQVLHSPPATSQIPFGQLGPGPGPGPPPRICRIIEGIPFANKTINNPMSVQKIILLAVFIFSGLPPEVKK